jgi:hypothetical protein
MDFMKTLFIAPLLALHALSALSPSRSHAALEAKPITIRANVFEALDDGKTSETSKAPSFQYTAVSKAIGEPSSGKKEFVGDFKSSDGKPAFSETISENKEGFEEYHYVQYQTGEEGSVIRKNGKIEYTKTTKKGETKKTETGSEDWSPEIQVGPLIVRFIEEQFPKIIKGEKAKFRIAVPDILDSVGFQAFKDGEEKTGDKTLIDVKMKPTSILIAAFVDPIHFFFDPATGKIVKMRGRMPVKKKVEGDWKDVIGLTLFE